MNDLAADILGGDNRQRLHSKLGNKT